MTSKKPAPDAASSTTVAFARGDLGVIWTLFPVVGAAVGWGLPFVAGWLDSLGWVPFGELVGLVASWKGTWGVPALVGAGAIAGAIFAAWVVHDAVPVDVSREHLGTRVDGRVRVVDRDVVGGVFYDGKALVAVDRDGREVWRVRPEATRARVEHAVREHGWPWLDDDPHATGLTRWVHGGLGLPPGADAILGARARALAAKDVADADDLLVEAGRVGIVVRDVDGAQRWGLLDSPPA